MDADGMKKRNEMDEITYARDVKDVMVGSDTK